MSLMRAFVLDDEPLAVERLVRLLRLTGRVEVVSTATDPVEAVEWLASHAVDVLFLDIEMPGLSGFEVLGQLATQPLVVFTTAYDRYALRAFEVHSVDYLLKPIEPTGIDRALEKLARMQAGAEPKQDLQAAIRAVLQQPAKFPTRVPSRVGDRIEFVDLAQVTHVYAEDKLTFAATAAGKAFVIDGSVSEWETRLDPEAWVRVHRSTLVHLPFVQEVHGFFGGRLVVRLQDGRRTELAVARERVSVLKARLGL